jgi:hypothetical protein
MGAGVMAVGAAMSGAEEEYSGDSRPMKYGKERGVAAKRENSHWMK